MSVQFEISQENFEYIKSIAEPLVDTIDSVLNRIISEHKPNVTLSEHNSVAVETSKPIHYSSNNPPPLKHTKILSATIGGIIPEKMTWDSCLRAIIDLIFSSELEHQASDILRGSGINTTDGIKSDQGFKYLEAYNVSYQGLPAEQASKAIFSIARRLSIQVQIEFMWRDKPDAFKPGKLAIIT